MAKFRDIIKFRENESGHETLFDTEHWGWRLDHSTAWRRDIEVGERAYVWTYEYNEVEVDVLDVGPGLILKPVDPSFVYEV